MQHFVIMGVAGCGKSSVAALLSQRIDAALIEADDLHGVANVEKMQRGEALCDDDRWPWLARVAEAMQSSSTPVLVSCSALRRAYRQYLLDTAGVPIGFVHLHADRDVIAQRMQKRKGHFMPVSLLDSQLRTLEPLHNDEAGVVVDITQSLSGVVDDALEFIAGQR